MLYQAFQQGMRLSRALLENVGQLYYNSLFLGNLFEFLALEPGVVTPERPKSLDSACQTIRFRSVSFRYPATDRLALRELDLESRAVESLPSSVPTVPAKARSLSSCAASTTRTRVPCS
jgi:ABC-type multidrug transport system fused ATPase/permease subunit